MSSLIVGVDEAGRGPLAGPVSVGVVALPTGFDWTSFAKARDSKKMSERAREEVYALLVEARNAKLLDFAVGFSSSTVIDTEGIVPAVSHAMAEAFSQLSLAAEECEVLLDGGLKAPEAFVRQQTIIRGDDSEPVISLASIAAKVERDHLLVSLAETYPGYGLEIHKGYGTKRHRELILEKGLSPIHRATFCRALHPIQNRV